jgi:hypothetical protein
VPPAGLFLNSIPVVVSPVVPELTVNKPLVVKLYNDKLIV